MQSEHMDLTRNVQHVQIHGSVLLCLINGLAQASTPALACLSLCTTCLSSCTIFPVFTSPHFTLPSSACCPVQCVLGYHILPAKASCMNPPSYAGVPCNQCPCDWQHALDRLSHCAATEEDCQWQCQVIGYTTLHLKVHKTLACCWVSLIAAASCYRAKHWRCTGNAQVMIEHASTEHMQAEPGKDGEDHSRTALSAALSDPSASANTRAAITAGMKADQAPSKGP